MPVKGGRKLAAAAALIIIVLIAAIYIIQLKVQERQATPSQQPQTTTRPEESARTWWIRFVDQAGRPLAGETIYFAVRNLTGRRWLATVEGVTDADGRISFTIPALPSTGNYSIVAAIRKYNRWMLLHKAEADWKRLIDEYANRTLVADRWLLLRLIALADLDGDGTAEPLKLPHGYVQFRILWPGEDLPIAEINANPANGTALTLLNMSDTTIEFSDDSYVAGQTVLLTEARWVINGTSIRIGSHQIAVEQVAFKGRAIIDIPIHVNGKRYTVKIVNPCVPSIDTANWTFSFRVNIDGKFVELCSGVPEQSCWLPDVTQEQGIPAILEVRYFGAQVLAVNFSTTESNATLLGNRVAFVTEAGQTRVDVRIPLVDVSVKVFDSQLSPKPLAGARIEVVPPVGTPIPVFTNIQGVALIRRLTSGLTYAVRIYYAWPGSTEWIDVTPGNNTFNIDADDAIQRGCPVYTFTFQAKIYEVWIRTVDLCGEGVSPATFPGLYLAAYQGDTIVNVIGLGGDGAAYLTLPGGRLKFRLFYKGVLMRANITSPIEPEIELTRNARITLQFPIGNLRIRIPWSGNGGTACGLNVKLQYLRNGRVIHEEPIQLADCHGTVTFTKVPLRPLNDLEKKQEYELRIIAFTAANVVVNKTIPFEALEPSCTSSYTVSG